MLTALRQWRKQIGCKLSRTEYMQEVERLPVEDRAAATDLYPVLDDTSILRVLHTFRMTVPQVRSQKSA